MDQGTPPAPLRMAGINVKDSIKIGSPNDLGAVDTNTGQFNTNYLGQWPDTYYVCSKVCPGSAGQSNGSQSWTANGQALLKANAVVYKCGSITIDGN